METALSRLSFQYPRIPVIILTLFEGPYFVPVALLSQGIIITLISFLGEYGHWGGRAFAPVQFRYPLACSVLRRQISFGVVVPVCQ